jgi:tetratricopeptide (TPR) repeat protein
LKITSPKLHTSDLTLDDEALLRCQTALESKDRSDYEGAQESLRPLWKRLGERPATERLQPAVAAEVLFCVGILTGWIGSKLEIAEAQEIAKDLLTECITYFESVGDVEKVAAARVEVAYCYWRDGELNEARIMLREALQKLTTEGNTRARAILKLVTIENSAGRYRDSLKLLNDNASLFTKLSNHAIEGDYHNELAITLEEIAAAEKLRDYFQRAVEEYKAADYCFKLARNWLFRASVKNNVAVVLLKLSRFKEAHKYLDEARRLTLRSKDKARIAQIDETRAQVLLAERRWEEAEAVASRAASALEKCGHWALVADALIIQGIALARQSKKQRAHFVFQKAIEVALQVHALNKAGLAALSLVEEIDQLSSATLRAAYQQAREWLADSQSQDIRLRVSNAAGKLATTLHDDLSRDEATEILLSKRFDLQRKVLEYERSMIKEALAQVDGRITHAASLLGLTHQGLAYIIEARHPDLLKERTPVHRRPRKDQ